MSFVSMRCFQLQTRRRSHNFQVYSICRITFYQISCNNVIVYLKPDFLGKYKKFQQLNFLYGYVEDQLFLDVLTFRAAFDDNVWPVFLWRCKIRKPWSDQCWFLMLISIKRYIENYLTKLSKLSKSNWIIWQNLWRFKSWRIESMNRGFRSKVTNTLECNRTHMSVNFDFTLFTQLVKKNICICDKNVCSPVTKIFSKKKFMSNIQ